eukprot:523586-Pelagomonas_calceolata.AAC.2
MAMACALYMLCALRFVLLTALRCQHPVQAIVQRQEQRLSWGGYVGATECSIFESQFHVCSVCATRPLCSVKSSRQAMVTLSLTMARTMCAAIVQRQEQRLGWGGYDDKAPPEKVTVIIYHMFGPKELSEDAEAAEDLEKEVLAEATKLGPVEKVGVVGTCQGLESKVLGDLSKRCGCWRKQLSWGLWRRCVGVDTERTQDLSACKGIDTAIAVKQCTQIQCMHGHDGRAMYTQS